MAHYNLIFQGKIVDGASLDEVKSNVARLFKADAEKTAALFSGKKIVIKKNLNTESTKKYLAVMKNAGAIIQAIKIEEAVDEVIKDTPKNIPDKPQPETQSPTSNLSSGLASLINYNNPQEQQEDKSKHSGLQLAAKGSVIPSVSRQDETVEIPDVSYLSMSDAETGSLEEFAQAIKVVELPDIENMTMSDANSGSMEEFTVKAEPVELPDISQLEMKEHDNTPLSSGSPKATPAEIPDTSELSMSEAQEATLEGIEVKPQAVELPDISHIKIEQTSKKEDKKESMTGKASFQIN